MNQAELIGLLERLAPSDEKEARDRDEIVAFVRTGGDPFARDRFAPGHLTGSAFVVDEALEKILLVHHARLDRWLQPGGHGEPGESDPLEVALREAREETGIEDLKLHPAAPVPFDVDVHVIPPSPKKNEPAHEHLDIRFLLVAPRDARPRASAESKAIAWLPLGEAGGEGHDASLARAVRKIRATLLRKKS
jgi:8-oxo-dGTP pyrophosphatase MutT (NUDIX family)